MKYFLAPLLFASFILCCKKDEIHEPIDLSPGVDWVQVKSTSYTIPFNGSSAAFLSAFSSSGDQVTWHAEFYVDDVPLIKNKFIPQAEGSYFVTAKYKDLVSAPVEINVVPPLSKKILIENFTSRTCGFCPWIGNRLDSLDQANPNVISYSIHGQDELETEETYDLQDLLSVYSRPSVRVNRGYVRNFEAPIEINELIDSVQFMLGSQPGIEISIQSSLNGNDLSAQVFCKYHSETRNDLYLTLMLVEDSVITQDQYNYFNGYPWTYCPFATLPFYLPEYVNHNVLRKTLTNPRGDLISLVAFEKNIVQNLGQFHYTIPPWIDIHHTKLIAILHRVQKGIEVSSVINSQIVKVGSNVDFDQ